MVKHRTNLLLILSGATFAAAVIFVKIYLDSNNKEDLSRLGDYLSGTMGIFLAVVFAIIAYYTYKQQVTTTHKQSFDEIFIKMLELHTEYLNRVAYEETGNGITILGRRKVFESLYDHLKAHYKEAGGTGQGDELSRIQNAYESFNNRFIEVTGPFIKHVYYLLRYVDDKNFLSMEEKTHYSRMIRTELSQYESLLLFYTGLSRRGNPKLKPLLEKYSVLSQIKHVRKELFHDDHTEFYARAPSSEL